MSMYQEARADIVSYVNKKGGTSFTVNDFAWSAVQAQPGGSPKNSKVRLTVLSAHATYKGSVVFNYNRLDVAGIANIPKPKYPPIGNVGDSIYTILQAIRNSYGVYLSKDDLQETFITDDGAGGEILLKAKATSYGWIGEYTLKLAPKPLLSSLFTSDAINWS